MATVHKTPPFGRVGGEGVSNHLLQRGGEGEESNHLLRLLFKRHETHEQLREGSPG